MFSIKCLKCYYYKAQWASRLRRSKIHFSFISLQSWNSFGLIYSNIITRHWYYPITEWFVSSLNLSHFSYKLPIASDGGETGWSGAKLNTIFSTISQSHSDKSKLSLIYLPHVVFWETRLAKKNVCKMKRSISYFYSTFTWKCIKEMRVWVWKYPISRNKNSSTIFFKQR